MFNQNGHTNSTNGNPFYLFMAKNVSADSWAEIDTKNLNIAYLQNAAFKYMTLNGSNLIFDNLNILDDKTTITANSINILETLHLTNSLVTQTPKVTITLDKSNGNGNTIDGGELVFKNTELDAKIGNSNLKDLGNSSNLRSATLSNFGTIILDGESIKSKNYSNGGGATLTLNGNLYNYNNINIGAGSKITIKGNFLNFGNIEFNMDKKIGSNVGAEDIKVGSIEVTGKMLIDISPGARQLMNVNMSDFINLPNTIVGKEYTLIELKQNGDNNLNNKNNSFIYTYSLGGYTTIITKNKNYNIKTSNILSNEYINEILKAIKDLDSSSATIDTDKTIFELGAITNPWDDKKASIDENGRPIEKDLGLRKSLNTKCSDEDNCSSTLKSNNTNVNNNNAYYYAQNKAKNSISFKSNGSDLIGKYLKVSKNITENKISFKIDMLNNANFNPNAQTSYCSATSSTFDCLLYTEAGNSNEWIDKVRNESVNSYEILKALFYNPTTQLKFIKTIDQSLANSRNIEYFLEVGRTLDNSLKHISDLFFKESSLNQALNSGFASRIERLVKLSSIYRNNYSSLHYAMLKRDELASMIIEQIQNQKFASSGDILFTSLQDMIQNYSKRKDYPNNIWINLMGNANFNDTGNALVYGFNSGYDYFINNTALGAYVGYGRGSFNGKDSNFLSNDSDNLTIGLYTRSFIEDNELDFNISYGFGIVNERMQNAIIRHTKNIIKDMTINNIDNLLTAFNQKYIYTVSNMQANFTYGRAFIMNKGYVLKPQVGIAYEVAKGSSVNGARLDIDNFLGVSTNDNFKNSIALNVGLEVRKYYKNGSYIFVLGNLKQDIFILKNSTKGRHNFVNIIGLNPINSPTPNALYSLGYIANFYNSIASINTGGEVALNKFFINGGISLSSSLFVKNFGLGLQIGARVIF